MEEIILDASILVKFFSQDEKDEVVDVLLDRYANKRLSFVVIDIAIYEMINALKISKKASAEFIYEAFSVLLEMNPRIIYFSENLVKKALEIIENFSITIYDALYIAQAEIERIRLLTSDYKHHQKQMSRYILHYKEFPGRASR